MLWMQWVYARALYEDTGATLVDLREATRRVVSVADRFRRSAATRPTPGSDDSRSTSTDAPPPPGDA
jgi:hypothetical protein